MTLTAERLQSVAKEVLAKGDVDLLLGWQKTGFWWQSPPAFVASVHEAEQLVWDSFCINNLSKYLLQELPGKGKAALFVKGCDSLAVNRLLQDNRIDRSRVLLLGVPCTGMVDPEKLAVLGLRTREGSLEREGKDFRVTIPGNEQVVAAADLLYDKCLQCAHPNPVAYDQLLGEEVAAPEGARKRFDQLVEIEQLDADGRYAFWEKQFSRCLQCFACRNVCPACNCRECVFDMAEPRWLGKADVLSERAFYHVIRAFHVAGRCLDCGECQRVCPVDLPLTKLNRKIIKDINELYGDCQAGLDAETAPPLIAYKEDDAAAFSES